MITVFNLINAFEGCKGFVLNLRDQDEMVWFFGDIQKDVSRVPHWCLNKTIINFTMVPVTDKSFIVMATFQD